LGALVTIEEDGINANHLPFEFIAPDETAPFGTLRAHIARGNSLWKQLNSSHEALVIFQGPTAYITPAWYEEKQISGKVVPTYNFAVVHAYGKLRVVDDAQWLLQHLQSLTQQQESKQTTPWQINDAPQDYIQKMMNAIIGLEIPLTKLSGKWKVSQNRSAQDRHNIATGLRASDEPMAHAMAGLVGK
jgi:transcriptional regulator